jgi:hypothetical protein
MLLNMDIRAAGWRWSILQFLLDGSALPENAGDWIPGLTQINQPIKTLTKNKILRKGHNIVTCNVKPFACGQFITLHIRFPFNFPFSILYRFHAVRLDCVSVIFQSSFVTVQVFTLAPGCSRPCSLSAVWNQLPVVLGVEAGRDASMDGLTG